MFLISLLRRKSIYILLLLISVYSIYPLIEKNDYNDSGLNEKNGTYGLSSYLRKSYALFFASIGLNYYSDIGGKIRLYLDPPELLGFYFAGDIYVSKNNLVNYSQGLPWWINFLPFLNESYVGYKHKYFNIKLGYQKLLSSDAIYNHLMIDDYSGSLFGLKILAMLSRFADIELIYSIVRPHQGPWYRGDSIITGDSVFKNDKNIYDVYYGKSLYSHKLNIRPLPWIRFGIFEGVYFVGENLNPWYVNPFFTYIGAQMISGIIKDKEGSRYNLHTANIMAGIDFNIGFNGWRLYGELLFDDSNTGAYLIGLKEKHPIKLGLIFGGELRGYLFTRFLNLNPIADFILKNIYINFEYGVVSKYMYARDSNFNYEYVRYEYTDRYDEDDPPDDDEVERVNRIGNFLGFMFGPNSNCIDFAVGWRSDLYDVEEYTAGYQNDVYFHSLKDKMIPKRLIKMQFHFRYYRLGDERNVIMPYFWNENPNYHLDTGKAKTAEEFGTSRGTEFLKQVLEIGTIIDFNFYFDIVRFSRFVLGLESKLLFHWITYYPFTSSQYTDLKEVRWEIGIIVSW